MIIAILEAVAILALGWFALGLLAAPAAARLWRATEDETNLFDTVVFALASALVLGPIAWIFWVEAVVDEVVIRLAREKLAEKRAAERDALRKGEE